MTTSPPRRHFFFVGEVSSRGNSNTWTTRKARTAISDLGVEDSKRFPVIFGKESYYLIHLNLYHETVLLLKDLALPGVPGLPLVAPRVVSTVCPSLRSSPLSQTTELGPDVSNFVSGLIRPDIPTGRDISGFSQAPSRLVPRRGQHYARCYLESFNSVNFSFRVFLRK
ncbi:hypothetical protein K440DRAFT_613760 [Wilcoxina mikolae CBS 423.85]|nr:hypothetical protein K440DRAFT_613760 [Wilcoxina mikolae CBS 423.85]